MRAFYKCVSLVLIMVMMITVLPINQMSMKCVAASEIPDINEETVNPAMVIYNDFEGENRTDEFTLKNSYNTVVSVVQDKNDNHKGVVTTSSSNGVTFSGLWHYGIISPKDSLAFDATSFVEGGRLIFYVYSEVSSKVYLGVEIGDKWYSYQGFADASESTQTAGRNSGRLQEVSNAGAWKKYSVKLSDFEIEDWKDVKGIAIGFYTTGTYYIDNIGFVSKDNLLIDEETSDNNSSDATYVYQAEDMQLNNMRFPTTSGIADGEAVGVYWTNTSEFKESLQKDSFARLIVEAPAEGNYKIQMKYNAGTYPVRIYVNGEMQIDEILPGNNWSNSKAEFNLSLSKGKNVLVFSVAAWGCFDYIVLPLQLKVVENTYEENTYYAQDAILQATTLEPYGSIFDADAVLYTGGLKYDSSDNYISKVAFNVDALEGQSLTLHYYVENYTTIGEATLECSINGNPKFAIDLSGTETHKEITYTIDANTLAEGGLWDGANEIVFTPAEGGSKVGLHYITLQKDIDYNPVERTTYTGVQLKDYISYRGRTLDINNSVTFDWSGSGFAFNFEGKGDIIATITVSGSSTTKIAIYVDDENRTTTNSENRIVKTISNGTNRIVLAKNLSEGKHTIEVLKCSEANGSLAQLDSITVNTGSKLTKWKKSDYNMLVIGGSVSCGNQIYADGKEDASLSYVANLALAYNMDWQTISCSGRGITQGYNSEDGWAASREKQLISLNEYTSFFRDKDTLWDCTEFTPDVIIVNAGGNDLGDAVMEKFGTTVDDFCEAVVEFSTELRQKYPNALICWFYGVYVNRAYKDEFQAAVDSMKDAGVKLVYTPQMNSGAANHPDVTEHIYLSQIFSEVFSEYWNVDNPLDEYNPNKAPTFDKTKLDSNKFIYNDFEGENRSNELVLENKYNTNIDILQDINLNHEGFVKTNSSNGPGVNFSTLWRYAVVKPKNAETFDASKLAKDGYLSFYVNSETASNVYVGVNINDVWYSYRGYIDEEPSTQEAARKSGKLQTKYSGNGEWYNYKVSLSDFNVENWSEVQGVAIGFYESGDYYIDNIEFSSPTVFCEETTEIPTTEESTTQKAYVEDSTTNSNVTDKISGTVKNADNKIVSLKKTKVVSATKKYKLKKAKISLKKIKGAKWYQIQISNKKKFNKKNILVNKKTKKIKMAISSKKLKNKYRLYIRARAVTIVNNKKYYGKWSVLKKVTIKK